MTWKKLKHSALSYCCGNFIRYMYCTYQRHHFIYVKIEAEKKTRDVNIFTMRTQRHIFLMYIFYKRLFMSL